MNINKRKIGTICEEAVSKFLKENGFTISVQNYRNGFRNSTEIDIVAEKNKVLHFIEVKARSSNLYGTPAEAVSPAKMKNIIKASEFFIKQSNGYHRERSYDIAEVYFSNTEEMKNIKIEKIKMIFSAYYK